MLEVDIAVDKENVHDQVCKILETLRPEWTTDDIKIDELSGGYLGSVYSITSPSYPDDILTLKVMGKAMADVFNQAGAYVLLKYLTQHHKHLLHIYCKFQNGYVYKFFPGRLTTLSELLDDSILTKIFHVLHQVHAVVLPDKMENDAQKFDTMEVFFGGTLATLKSEKAAILDKDERVLAAGLSRSALVELGTEVLQEYVTLRKGQPNVLCHGDTWMNNIIINEHAEEVHVIDWDLVRVTCEIYDLAVAACPRSSNCS